MPLMLIGLAKVSLGVGAYTLPPPRLENLTHVELPTPPVVETAPVIVPQPGAANVTFVSLW